MAFTVKEEVGAFVYRRCSPKQAGVIAGIVHPSNEPITNPDGTSRPRYFPTVRIKWVNGTETEEDTSGLMDFTSLVEDHLKKLKTHGTTLAKLQRIKV